MGCLWYTIYNVYCASVDARGVVIIVLVKIKAIISISDVAQLPALAYDKTKEKSNVGYRKKYRG